MAPDLLSNFMSDRGNQVTLGTFIATFVYSLVVLRTIRSAGESGAGAPAFVPQLALLVALILVLCSIAVLIFFIHHVPMRIHINNVIERIGDRLIEEIDRTFPGVRWRATGGACRRSAHTFGLPRRCQSGRP